MEGESIGRDSMVEVHYRLLDEGGAQLDSSEPDEPLHYVHGYGQIIPGLERELEGRAAGDRATIVVPPDEGFGPHHTELVFEVPRRHLEFEVEVGTVVSAQLPEGRSHYFQVTGMSGDSVTLDGNHPFAGKTLLFEVAVESVRRATVEELQEARSESDEHEH